MKKFVLIFVFLALIADSFPANISAASFSDLPSDHRFYREMMFLEKIEIIQGFPDGTFRPDAPVTRAAAAIMIGRVLGLDDRQRDTAFSDVKADLVASGYIASAAARGIIKGYPNGTFRPNENVTRGQMAIFLSRAFELTVEADAPFSDISPSMASFLPIKRIVAENLAQGYPDNTFRPNEKVTRAQYSAFLARALNDEFKVDLPHSFLKDKNKAYTFKTFEDGTARFVYSDDEEDYPGWNHWYVYEDGDYVYSIKERQDSEGYKSALSHSEYYSLGLAFPIEVGRRWSHEATRSVRIIVTDEPVVDEVPITNEITAVNMTVTTPAGTFHHVVEVKDSTGFKTYWAPNAGLIKAVSAENDVFHELTKIENR